MNKILTSFLTFFVATLMAQSPLPATWDASGAEPVGWTNSGTSTYSTGNIGAPSIKLSATGQYQQVYFSDEPGAVTYYIKGQTANGAPYQGTFSIQESVDGSAWTDLRVLTGSDLSTSSYTMFTDMPASTTRYIRWYYTNKVSGANVSLDDITISLPVAGPLQEINLSDKLNNSVIILGYYYLGAAVGNTVNDTLYIKNLGLDSTLVISNIALSGGNAAEFSIIQSPTSVNALDSAKLVFSFTPTQAGARWCQVTIDNNDANENPYTFFIQGYGDFLGIEPSTQPTSLNFSMVKSYRLGFAFTGNGSDGYLVLRKKGSAITQSPTDGVEYNIGDDIGGAQVTYSGANTSVVLNNIKANENHYVAVFAYNGLSVYKNYNTTAPLMGSQTSSGSMQASMEYAGVNTGNSSFIADLGAVINPHYSIYYSEFDETYIDLFASRDTINGQKVVTGVYTGFQHVYHKPFAFDVLSREHTYPNSWFPTEGLDDLPEYSDQHNLYPAHQNEANAVRSNKPLGEVVVVESQFMEGKYGKDANGKSVYEPRDSHKGDAARAIFYMATAYDGVSGNDWSLPENISFTTPYGQDQDVLKKWHYLDPPSNFEIARNDFLDSLQGNRNPFVDSAHYACYINFADMTWIENPAQPCTTTATGMIPNITTYSSSLVEVFPNPTSDFVNVKFLKLAGENEVKSIDLYDEIGQLVYQNKNTLNTIDMSSYRAGLYTLKVSVGNKSQLIKLTKQ